MVHTPHFNSIVGGEALLPSNLLATNNGTAGPSLAAMNKTSWSLLL
jgi:hypothetical protein